ncbi:MAG TPA: hypothetical protein VES19_14590 [Candidatus Limnocylindrales bacterium]|nr:hypothetical protein [Candidatus Limnocylindrales bacterium]
MTSRLFALPEHGKPRGREDEDAWETGCPGSADSSSVRCSGSRSLPVLAHEQEVIRYGSFLGGFTHPNAYDGQFGILADYTPFLVFK